MLGLALEVYCGRNVLRLKIALPFYGGIICDADLIWYCGVCDDNSDVAEC